MSAHSNLAEPARGKIMRVISEMHRLNIKNIYSRLFKKKESTICRVNISVRKTGNARRAIESFSSENFKQSVRAENNIFARNAVC